MANNWRNDWVPKTDQIKNYWSCWEDWHWQKWLEFGFMDSDDDDWSWEDSFWDYISNYEAVTYLRYQTIRDADWLSVGYLWLGVLNLYELVKNC